MNKIDHEINLASIRLIRHGHEQMQALLRQYPATSFGAQEELLYALVKCSQQAAVECRALYRRTGSPPESDAARDRLSELGYCCELIDDAVRIELPLLLPKRGCDCSFLLNPLNELLSLSARDIPKFHECTVVFQHFYSEHHKPADIRDHDNVESRAVLNVIERYLLTSDSGYYCTNIQMTRFSTLDKTVIWLIPGRLDWETARKAARA